MKRGAGSCSPALVAQSDPGRQPAWHVPIFLLLSSWSSKCQGHLGTICLLLNLHRRAHGMAVIIMVRCLCAALSPEQCLQKCLSGGLQIIYAGGQYFKSK